MARQVVSPRRKSALASMKKIEAQQQSAKDYNSGKEKEDEYDSDQEVYVSDDSISDKPLKKKIKAGKNGRSVDSADMLGLFERQGETSKAACEPPTRRHNLQYHRPLLMDGKPGRKSRDELLIWFDSVSTSRSMPWRKTWVDPTTFNDKEELRETLKRRAYEVWISEIMLQQTRVSTVIGYWTNWISKWPTIEDLAKAEPEEVLSAWRGLGYYSRATRIHTAAKKVVEDGEMKGLLPETADLLQKNVPGVGRYTGGAISSIVFGNAAAMVDGNVLRVLSRQLGLYGDVKGSKQIIDLLWNAANALVKKVAMDTELGDDDIKKSDRPGRWGQALMELGSTICTPNPSCRSCPITSTCRTYSEGRSVASKEGLLSLKPEEKILLIDIEDTCRICEPFEDAVVDEGKPKNQANGKEKGLGAGNKQSTLASFAFTNKAASNAKKFNDDQKNPKVLEIIEGHSKKFPMKLVKKAVRQEETIVCAIRNQNDEYLLQQRPEKGEYMSLSLKIVFSLSEYITIFFPVQDFWLACGSFLVLSYQTQTTV